MDQPVRNEVLSKLEALQSIFHRQLPGKIADINKAWASWLRDDTNTHYLKDIHFMAHSLAGAGGTFGAMALSTEARELELLAKTLKLECDQGFTVSKELQIKLEAAIARLEQVASSWQPSVVPYIKPDEFQDDRISNLIYLAEDDDLLAADLVSKLEEADYQVRHFSELQSFEKACESERPAAIIMDIVFEEGDVAGAEVISRIRSKFDICPPVVFISVRDDIEARLAVARAGGNRYICKPIDKIKLVQTVDGLTARVTMQPYRVLLVDDDETLLDYYSTVLRDAGMDVNALHQPLNVLNELVAYQPDIIVTDVYMPECTGLELAQVIRQDDAWALTPILFLSTESNINRQLAAMKLGGDDFLEKPVDPHYFCTTIRARAKRARWARQINKEMQNALRENEYQLVTMNQHDIFSVADIGGRIINVNDKFCEISGYSRDELIGQNHRIIKSDYHSSDFYQDLWSAISHGKIWRGTVCNHKKNGEKYWVDATIVPFLDANGNPYKYVSARTDITERIQAQHAVRESEERFSFAVEGAGAGVWDWDMRSNKVEYSDIWMSMLGYAPGDLAYDFGTFATLVHPDDVNAVQQKLNDYLDDKVSNYSIELRMRCKDGSYKWILSRGRKIGQDEHGKPLRMTGIHSDITLHKNTEQSLIYAREEAEKANLAKTKFLSSMSHELRTPMNAIMGFGQLLKMDCDEPLTKLQQENVDEIMKAGDHLLELINEVLDLSKIESGRIDISFEVVNLSEVIEEAIKLITPLAKKRGIKIGLSLNGRSIEIENLLQQKIKVWVDRTRLKQVLLNLLSNATKYNIENGALNIDCSLLDGEKIRISVSDTGKGLSQKAQTQLFKAFNRLGAEQSNVEGTGIGLVITKNIIELMGGSIGLKSELGQGSCFWVELPNDPSRYLAANDIQRSAANPLDITVSSEDGHTVLYIEDNPANLRLVSQLLSRRENFRMLTALEPVLGLEMAEKYKPDLILLDINLPGMSGFEVLAHLRQQQATHKTPIIAISANAMPEDIEVGLAAGFDDYISKPIDAVGLLLAVNSKLSKK